MTVPKSPRMREPFMPDRSQEDGALPRRPLLVPEDKGTPFDQPPQWAIDLRDRLTNNPMVKRAAMERTVRDGPAWMQWLPKGVTQTILADDDLNQIGVYGNCIQASVATLFDLPLDAVPHFAAFDDWPAALSLWAKGWDLIVKGARTDHVPEGPCLVGGDSPRGGKHMVVGDVGRVVWDPHPSRDGLTKITEVTWFEPAEEVAQRCDAEASRATTAEAGHDHS